MPVQFPYPETGWSTGKMRKRGDQLAANVPKDPYNQQRVGEATGGGRPTGAAGTMRESSAVQRFGVALSKEQVDQHKQELQDGFSDYNKGNLTPDEFSKMVADRGWTMDPNELKKKDQSRVSVTDPNGNLHALAQ